MGFAKSGVVRFLATMLKLNSAFFQEVKDFKERSLGDLFPLFWAANAKFVARGSAAHQFPRLFFVSRRFSAFHTAPRVIAEVPSTSTRR